LLLIVMLGALSGIGPLAIDMYLPAFPAIAADFGTNVPAIERTLATYFVGLSLGQLVYGPLTDRFGRKRPLYVGLVLFVLASAGITFANSVNSMAALRFVQALGGCAQMVVARAVVRDLFGERRSAKVFSALILVMGIAPIVAPILGGFLVSAFGWQSIFWVLTGFSAVCLVAVIRFLPESLPRDKRRKRNVGQILRVYAGLFKHRTFMIHTLAGSLCSAALFAYIGGSPFIFMELFGIAESNFGYFFGANAFGLIVASQVNGAIAERVDPRLTVRVSLAVAALAGIALLVVSMNNLGGMIGHLIPLFVFMCSLGFILPTSTALALAPHGETAGSASAIYGFLQFFLSGIGGLLVSAFHNDTAVPMTLVIAVCVTVALAINLTFVEKRAP
jgi:DHA1 family bicyclomycin/chloramphenicol resistance-like MFS transporter